MIGSSKNDEYSSNGCQGGNVKLNDLLGAP